MLRCQYRYGCCVRCTADCRDPSFRFARTRQHEARRYLVRRVLQGDPGQQLLGLRKREPQFLQRDDPVELPQLGGRVAAVAGLRIHSRGEEQPDLLVVPECANGYRSEPGELADAEHDTSLHPSRNVRVKCFRRGRAGLAPALLGPVTGHGQVAVCPPAVWSSRRRTAGPHPVPGRRGPILKFHDLYAVHPARREHAGLRSLHHHGRRESGRRGRLRGCSWRADSSQSGDHPLQPVGGPTAPACVAGGQRLLRRVRERLGHAVASFLPPLRRG